MSSKNSVSAACAAAVFAVAALWAPTASAVTFTTSDIAISISGITPTVSFNHPVLNSNINLGTPLTINNFIVGTLTGTNTNDVTGTISAAFTFTDPSSGSTTDSGTVTGSVAGSNLKGLAVTWTDPITITFSDGTKLQIDLGNGSAGCTGNCGVGDTINMSGTFTLLNAPTVNAVPLPGALPLFATGLGALGLLGWRKRKKAPISA